MKPSALALFMIATLPFLAQAQEPQPSDSAHPSSPVDVAAAAIAGSAIGMGLGVYAGRSGGGEGGWLIGGLAAAPAAATGAWLASRHAGDGQAIRWDSALGASLFGLMAGWVGAKIVRRLDPDVLGQTSEVVLGFSLGHGLFTGLIASVSQD